MTQIDKGKISSFESDVDRNGDLINARVLPSTAQSMPTRPLILSWHLRGVMGNLKVGDEVWFAMANDLTGIILERADGEWTGTISGNVTTTGKLTSTDLTTDSVTSVNSHVHTNGNNGANTGTPTN